MEVRPRAGSRVRCAFCHREAALADLQSCARCRTLLHAPCRNLLPRCPTLGCEVRVGVSIRAREIQRAPDRSVWLDLLYVFGCVVVFNIGVVLLLAFATGGSKSDKPVLALAQRTSNRGKEVDKKLLQESVRKASKHKKLLPELRKRRGAATDSYNRVNTYLAAANSRLAPLVAEIATLDAEEQRIRRAPPGPLSDRRLKEVRARKHRLNKQLALRREDFKIPSLELEVKILRLKHIEALERLIERLLAKATVVALTRPSRAKRLTREAMAAISYLEDLRGSS